MNIKGLSRHMTLTLSVLVICLVVLSGYAGANNDTNQGFSVSAGAEVVVEIDNVLLNKQQLKTYFFKSRQGDQDRYSALKNKFFGTEVVTIEAFVRDVVGKRISSGKMRLGKIDTTPPESPSIKVVKGGGQRSFEVDSGANLIVMVNGAKVKEETLLQLFSVKKTKDKDTYTEITNAFSKDDVVEVDAFFADKFGNWSDLVGKHALENSPAEARVASVKDAESTESFSVTQGAAIRMSVSGRLLSDGEVKSRLSKTTKAGYDIYRLLPHVKSQNSPMTIEALLPVDGGSFVSTGPVQIRSAAPDKKDIVAAIETKVNSRVGVIKRPVKVESSRILTASNQLPRYTPEFIDPIRPSTIEHDDVDSLIDQLMNGDRLDPVEKLVEHSDSKKKQGVPHEGTSKAETESKPARNKVTPSDKPLENLVSHYTTGEKRLLEKQFPLFASNASDPFEMIGIEEGACCVSPLDDKRLDKNIERPTPGALPTPSPEIKSPTGVVEKLAFNLSEPDGQKAFQQWAVKQKKNDCLRVNDLSEMADHARLLCLDLMGHPMATVEERLLHLGPKVTVKKLTYGDDLEASGFKLPNNIVRQIEGQPLSQQVHVALLATIRDLGVARDATFSYFELEDGFYEAKLSGNGSVSKIGGGLSITGKGEPHVVLKGKHYFYLGGPRYLGYSLGVTSSGDYDARVEVPVFYNPGNVVKAIVKTRPTYNEFFNSRENQLALSWLKSNEKGADSDWFKSLTVSLSSFDIDPTSSAIAGSAVDFQDPKLFAVNGRFYVAPGAKSMRGVQLDLALKKAFDPSSSAYVKADAKFGTELLPLPFGEMYFEWRGGLTAIAGNIQDVPVPDRVYLGGDSTVRGVNPNDYGSSSNVSLSGGRVGGFSQFELSRKTEVAGQDVYVGVHADMGYINGGPRDLDKAMGSAGLFVRTRWKKTGDVYGYISKPFKSGGDPMFGLAFVRRFD